MRPVAVGLPVPEGWRKVTFAADQPEYLPLQGYVSSGPTGDLLTRWRPTWRERLRVLVGADVFLDLWLFGQRCRKCGEHQPLSPMKLLVGPPAFAAEDALNERDDNAKRSM